MTVARFRGDATGTQGPDDQTFQLDPVTGAPRVIAMDTIPVTFHPAGRASAARWLSRRHLRPRARRRSRPAAVVRRAADRAGLRARRHRHGRPRLALRSTDTHNNFASQIPGFTGDATMPDGFGDRTGPAVDVRLLPRLSRRRRRARLDPPVRARPVARQPARARGGPRSVRARARRPARHAPRRVHGRVVRHRRGHAVRRDSRPDIDLYVLDVPGGGILDLLLPTSADIGSLALPLIDTIYNPKAGLDRWNQMIGLMQAVIDGGDPLSYAPHVLRDRFGALGRAASCASRSSATRCCRTWGPRRSRASSAWTCSSPTSRRPPARRDRVARGGQPRRPDGGARAVRAGDPRRQLEQRDRRAHLTCRGSRRPGTNPFPKLPAAITIRNPIYETLAQVGDLLTTHQAGELPRVRSTLAPIADFDDDGVPMQTTRRPTIQRATDAARGQGWGGRRPGKPRTAAGGRS